MTSQLRSELLKLRTTRTIALLLLAATAFAVFGTATEGLAPTTGKLAHEQTQRTMLSGGTSGVFFAALAGILLMTAELRYGTIRPTLLVEPRRRVVLIAKLLTAAITGIAFGALCAAASFAAGLVILAARDTPLTLTRPHALALTAGVVAASSLSAMLGVAIGTLVRNQAGAIVALAAYAVAIDAALFAAAPTVGRYLPGKAGDALSGRPTDALLAPTAGAAILTLWTLAFIAAATIRNDRTDV